MARLYWPERGDDPSRPLNSLTLDPVQGVWRRVRTGEIVPAAEVGARRQDQTAALQFEEAQAALLAKPPIIHDRTTNTYYERRPDGLRQIPAEAAAGREATGLEVVGEAQDHGPGTEPRPVLRDRGTRSHSEHAEGGGLQGLPGAARADGSRPLTFLEQVEDETRASGLRPVEVPDVRPPEVSRRDLELAV